MSSLDLTLLWPWVALWWSVQKQSWLVRPDHFLLKPRIGTERDRTLGPESAIWERAYQPMYRVFDKEIQQEHSENSEFPCMWLWASMAHVVAGKYSRACCFILFFRLGILAVLHPLPLLHRCGGYLWDSVLSCLSVLFTWICQWGPPWWP